MAHYRKRTQSSQTESLVRGLGWLSVGMGIAQIVAPRLVTRLVGLPLPPSLTVAFGVRELVCGIGLLTQEQKRPWIKARVAGDAVDLAVFGTALAASSGRPRLAAATAAVAGVTVLDLYCSREFAKNRRRPAPRYLRMSVNVERTPEEVYAFWRDLRNLPRVMPCLESVEVHDDVRSHWVLDAAGARAEWDAEIIDDVPSERLAWRAVEGASHYDAGSVQFVPAPSGGTDVAVELLYEPAPATFGTAVALLCGFDTAREMRADLEAFKRIMEDR